MDYKVINKNKNNICLNKGFFLNNIANKREQPQTLCSQKGLIIAITIK